ncbi:MAG: hypothetical protein ACTSYB_06600 [Candidatus Helarchaeota archaeon]
MGKERIFEIELPIGGKLYRYQTDLICNCCGKLIDNGEYLYFCIDCEDDLCSSYECLKHHAGHRFFRWGRIETETPIEKLVHARPAPPKGSEGTPIKIQTQSLPAISPADPSSQTPSEPPGKRPIINSGLLNLRTEFLKELNRLKSIMEGG